MKTTDWGQSESKNLLIELFPLPSPGTNDWKYPKWVDLNTNLEYLNNRKSYRLAIIAQRIKLIKDKIDQYKPEVVLFYGNTMKNYWDEIIGPIQSDELKIFTQKVKFSKKNNTHFFQCPHPTSRELNSIRKDFWIVLGDEIRKCLENNIP
jgi:hypothetical protein